MKRFVIILGLLGLVALIAGIKFLQINTLIHMKSVVPLEAVSTTPVKLETWQEALTSVGSLSAVQGVTVAAELDGKIAGPTRDAIRLPRPATCSSGRTRRPRRRSCAPRRPTST